MTRAQSAYDELRGVIDESEDGAPTSSRRWAGPTAKGSEPPSEEPAVALSSWPLAALELCSLRLSRGGGRALSLRFEAGAIVVLSGPTGVGKTTLLRALLGLERAASGDIVFDGKSLRDAPAGPRSRPFAWVPQEAPILADTLEANIALGAPGADARAALETVGAGHLVSALRGARLGAGGRLVSGGERQWISLARAIATRQPVLLLDEPTSGLDETSQEKVLAAIARLRGKRTVLLVTHRPEPLAIADFVVRLDAAGAAYSSPASQNESVSTLSVLGVREVRLRAESAEPNPFCLADEL
jgi:ABC-type transport system involved in cytochrome bd biosynthesis fused ATPase/permease subunit